MEEKTTAEVTEEIKEEPAVKTFTQEEVNEILKERLARENEKNKKEAQRQIAEAQKLAQMNEAEKAKYELEELRKEVAEYKKKDAITGLTRTARQMLAESGINVGDDLLAMLVTDDAESTKAAVESFSSLFSAALEAELKNRFKSAPPKAGSAAPLTKEQILAEKDTKKRQQLITENISLFK